MDTTLLVEAASQAGVTGPAMVDALARGHTYFSAKEPTPEHLSAWIAGLKTEAPHLFAPPAPGPGGTSEAIPDWLPPAERLARARALQPQPPVSRRPVRYDPSPQQLRELDGLTPMQKLARYREWQAQAQGGSA